jgi:hypothetical protein
METPPNGLARFGYCVLPLDAQNFALLRRFGVGVTWELVTCGGLRALFPKGHPYGFATMFGMT